MTTFEETIAEQKILEFEEDNAEENRYQISPLSIIFEL